MKRETRESIENRIKEIEKLSSVEYVTCFVDRSSDYGPYRGLLAVFAAFLTLFFSRVMWVDVAPWIDFLIAWAVAVAVFAATGLPAVLGWLLPPGLKKAEVLEAAHGAFLREEVFSTKGRTGVLVFVSVLEQAVFLLADKGLREKVRDDEWGELGASLAKDLDSGNAGPTFLAALEALSQRLSADFPPCAENPNELPDHVR
jgi:putative membrane protein